MSGFNRPAVIRRLVDLAKAIPAVDVNDVPRSVKLAAFYDWPGDRGTTGATMWFSLPEGDQSKLSISPAPMTDDDFTVSGELVVYGCTSQEDADESVVRILNAFNAELRSARGRLKNATTNAAAGDDACNTESAGISSLQGPWHEQAQPGGNAHMGRATFTVSVKTAIY